MSIARMIKWICNVRPEDRIFAEECRTLLKLKSMRECLQNKRLHWSGHLEEIEYSAWFSKYKTSNVSDNFPRARPSNTRNEVNK